MDCPYCAEPIKDEAIACRYCGRDLFVIRPLMDKLADATRRLEALGPAVSGATAAAPAAPSHVLPTVAPVTAMTLTFVLLVLAHYTIIVEYNLPLILLRMVSIAVPFAFGLLCREFGRRTLAIEFLYGLIIAVISILVMSKIVGKIDNVPVFPRTAYEWREFAEYGASIAFGFLTGAIVRQILIAMRWPDAKPNWLIGAISRVLAEKLGGEKVGFNVKTIQTLVSAVAAAGSAIASLVTGLSQFF